MIARAQICRTGWSVIALFAALLTTGRAQAEDMLDGAKLLLTNGVTSVEGSSGGGLATWATVSGMETDKGIGITAHAALVTLPDFRLQSHGFSIGIKDRLELSYARQNFDTRLAGAALGIGQGYKLNQHIFAAKLRLAGDTVYGEPYVPQIAIGIQHKRNSDGAVIRAVGGSHDQGTDYTLSATKLLLRHGLLVNATLRFTKANQFGLLGYGGNAGKRYSLQFEGTLAMHLSRGWVVGGEYRSKPDNLNFAEENNAKDIFTAYALTRNVTLTAAYVDLGSIATFDRQRGALFSLQLGF